MLVVRQGYVFVQLQSAMGPLSIDSMAVGRIWRPWWNDKWEKKTEVLRGKTVQCHSLREVLNKIKMKPCRLVNSYRPFRKICHFHIQGLSSAWIIIIIIIIIVVAIPIASYPTIF